MKISLIILFYDYFIMSKNYKNLYLKYKAKYISERKRVGAGSLYVSDLTQSTVFEGLSVANESGITTESIQEIEDKPTILYNEINGEGKLEFELKNEKKFINFISRDQIFVKDDIVYLFFTKDQDSNIKMFYFTNKDPIFTRDDENSS